MTIFVTGGAGFIGSSVVMRLLKKNVTVVNVDKLTYAGNVENLGDYAKHPHYHFYKEDICNQVHLLSIMKKHRPTAIVHMAAESHVDRSIDCADEFIQTNVVGTQRVLDAALGYYRALPIALRNAFRFLHVSTDEVFGALPQTGKFTENSPYAPNSPYAASKAASDFLVRAYHKTHRLPTIIVNSSNNYGPRQYPEKLIPLMILNALSGKPLPVYGDGQHVRDWLYVDDYGDALYALLCHGHVGEQYCIGANNECSNLSLIEKICDHLQEIRPHANYHGLIAFVQDRPGHDFRYATDSSKLMKNTGWFPKTDFNKGLSETIKWYVDKYERIPLNGVDRLGLGVMA